MMFKSRRINDLIVISAGPLGSAVASIVLIFILSWFFEPDTLGLVAIMELVALFFVMIFTFGFDQAYVREFATASDQNILFASAMAIPLILCVVVALSLAIALPAFDQPLLPGSGASGTRIAIAYGAAALIIRMLSTSARMSKSPLAFATLQLAQRSVTLCVLAICLLLNDTHDTTTVLLCYLAGSWISVALHLAVCRREVARMFDGNIDKALLVALFRFGWPTAIAAIFYALLSSADRLSLAFFGTSRDLGIYSVAVSVAGAVSIFTIVFGIIWAPLVFRHEAHAAERSAIVPYMELVGLMTFIAGGAIAIASWFLPALFPKDYSALAYFVPACMALPILYILSEAFGIGIALSRRTQFATMASAMGALAAIATSFVLVPKQGATGAAMGILAGSLAFLIARTEFSASLWYQFPRTRMYLAVTAYGVGCVISLWFESSLGWLFPAYWLALCIFAVILFRSRLPLLGTFFNEATGRR
jgi:O-antigen/teichoic acid export membrane protein